MASASAASHGQLRIVSRRAQTLLQKHLAQHQGKSPAINGKNKSVDRGGSVSSGSGSSNNNNDTPWPAPLRYTFYTACAAAVPISIGTAIAMSPRLREWLLKDDDDLGTVEISSSTSHRVVQWVRHYWGHDDYVPPVDRPALKHAMPGYRIEWQEDNWSSFLALLGLYTTKSVGEIAPASTSVEENIPMSLDNEPPTVIRKQQHILSRYLSPKYNPMGVKTHLSLIPCDLDNHEVYYDKSSSGEDAVYCNLPGNVSMNVFRKTCQVSKVEDAQCFLQETFQSLPSTSSSEIMEKIQKKSWNGDCYRWVVDFADSDEETKYAANVTTVEDEHVSMKASLGGDGKTIISPAQQAAKMLCHDTSVHSAWSYFPEFASSTGKNTASSSPSLQNKGSKFESRSMSASPASNTAARSTSAYDQSQQFRMQQLQHQIESLTKELNDAQSLRDRDSMFEELQSAKKELRSLKPGWWRRIWG